MIKELLLTTALLSCTYATDDINLNDLGNQGITMTGTYGSGAGTAVSGVGDVNGDGFPDMLMGAPNDEYQPSSVYLIYGSKNLTNIDLDSDLGKRGIVITDSTGGQVGFALSGAGDVNGDGLDDMLITSINEGFLINTVYLLYGSRNLTNIDLPNSNGKAVTFTGTYMANTGSSVSGAGDVNHDGYDDFLIGAPGDSSTAMGVVYLIYGSPHLTNMTLDSLGANGITFNGVNSAGRSVSGAGDINNDSYADILMGAPYASSYTILDDTNLATDGATYLIYGAPPQVPGPIPTGHHNNKLSLIAPIVGACVGIPIIAYLARYCYKKFTAPSASTEKAANIEIEMFNPMDVQV